MENKDQPQSQPQDNQQPIINSESPVKPMPLNERPKHGKRYPNGQKLAVLAMKGNGSAKEVSQQFGIGEKTVNRIWNDPEFADLSPTTVSKIKKGLGGLFYRRAFEAAATIDQDKLNASSALQLATVSGIMTEKARLMEGLSTENHSHAGFIGNLEIDREKIMRRLDSLEEKPE